MLSDAARNAILVLHYRTRTLEAAIRAAAENGDTTACDILHGAIAECNAAMEVLNPDEEEGALFHILGQYAPDHVQH